MKNQEIVCEYIETDSKGGYSLGNNMLVNERRYHSLYTFAKNPPIKRVALLKSLEVRLIIDGEEKVISSHAYDGKQCPKNPIIKDVKFNSFPIPTWHYYLNSGIEIKHELFLQKDNLYLFWKLESSGAYKEIKLIVKPLFSGNDHHALLKAGNENICVESEIFENLTRIYFSNSDILCSLFHNGDYCIKGFWYYNIFLKEEKNRGFDYLEDLYMPGDLTFDLSEPAVICLNLGNEPINSVVDSYRKAKELELKERGDLYKKTSNHFIVEGSKGKTIIAGYPWFTDWGRDTFISLRGLCLAVNDLETAQDIILRWSNYVSQGMIPNRFTDYEQAEYNTVDASLWFIVCAYELIEKAKEVNFNLSLEVKEKILKSITLIIDGYIEGTRYNIKMDESDALISQGISSKALTWMDARVDGSPVTPRIGKAVEIQALWINALKISSILLNKGGDLYSKASDFFLKTFWIDEKNYFFDVVKGSLKDDSFRPNQIYTIGGLPFSLISKEKAKLLLKQVEEKLLTPFGLRSLSEDNPNYKNKCVGNPFERDLAYHQGTVWGFLIGPYLESYLRVHDFSSKAVSYANEKLSSLEALFNFKSAGQCFEIYDGGKGNAPRGCPFQAWSFSEYLRIKELLK